MKISYKFTITEYKREMKWKKQHNESNTLCSEHTTVSNALRKLKKESIWEQIAAFLASEKHQA